MRSVPGGLVRMAVVGAGVAWMAVAPSVAWGQGGARVLGVQVAAGTAPDPLGAQVTSVVAGSLAQRLGVRAGDRLLKIGRVELASRPTDPSNAAPPSERLRAAVAEAPEIVPVVVWREGQLLTGLGSWREDFVPVPLHDAESLLRAFSELAEQGMVPVQGFGGGRVPGQGMVPAQGSGLVPSTGGGGSVPGFGGGGVPGSGAGGTVPGSGGSGRVPGFGGGTVPGSGGNGTVPGSGGSGSVPGTGGGGSVPSTGGMSPVPGGGGCTCPGAGVPASGGDGSVPRSGGAGNTPTFGSAPVPRNGGAGNTPTFGTTPVPSSGGAGSVPSFGNAPVPKTGGAGSVPSFGDATVPSFGSVPVPSTGGEGRVPATGGQGRVPSSGGVGSVPVGGERPVLRPGEEAPRGGDRGSQPAGPDRAWRAACTSLQGTRLNATYQGLSRSGAAQEQLRFQPDGSYALLRSSAVSSYAEDGCYAISGGSITFYKALSSALASAPGATSDRRVSLGSASQGAFEPRTVSFAREGNGQGGVVIDGERYWVQR